MMNVKITAGAVTVAVAVLAASAACGTIVTAGTVVAKRSVPAHPVLQNGGIGWQPQSWQVEVRAASGSEEWFTVTKSAYQHISIHSHWSIPS